MNTQKRTLRSLLRDMPLIDPLGRSLLRSIERGSDCLRRWRITLTQRCHQSISASILPIYGSQATTPEPTLENLTSQLCTQKQFKSPIYKRWCAEIREVPRFHRKQWEFVYILEALERQGMLAEGRHGLGFGCGQEPLPAVMAKHGCRVLVTDLDPARAAEQGWRGTSQHVANIEELHAKSRDIVDKAKFHECITYREVDMNNIPPDLRGQFDFVWSACSLEHLGSLQHGGNFIQESLRCLKPGGVAVHTTEFNLSSSTKTCETKAVSIFRTKDIESIFRQAQAKGFETLDINVNAGNSLLDKYIDTPPFLTDPHIKVLVSEFVTTSIGLLIRKPL